ncbi:uncharacterized protein METZ01_LOCUS230885, partial [marine metagenome]
MIEVVTAYWIKIFATLVVFFILIIFFLRNGNAKSRISGAELVTRELGRLGENYKIFHDVIVRSERGMLHIDYVVVSSHGVFVLTRCDLSGKIFGNKDDREWKVKTKGVEDTILNPLWENRKHINALEKKIGPRPFIPGVIFTNAKLVDDFGPIVVS